MKKIIALFFIFLFVGCNANLSKKEKNYIEKPESEFYRIGIEQYNRKNYKNSIKEFSSLRSIYSHSEFAEKSILYLIDIYIKEKKYNDALILMEELISEYPGYEYNAELNYDYAMTFYKSVEKQLRDNDLIMKVKNILRVFLTNFPNSKYRIEIEKEIININCRLVYREMEVGYFYEIQRNYTSALKRYLIAYQYDIENYKNSIYAPELLYRIYYCYFMIGLKSEGEKYYNKLNNEFRNTSWVSLAKLVK